MLRLLIIFLTVSALCLSADIHVGVHTFHTMSFEHYEPNNHVYPLVVSADSWYVGYMHRNSFRNPSVFIGYDKKLSANWSVQFSLATGYPRILQIGDLGYYEQDYVFWKDIAPMISVTYQIDDKYKMNVSAAQVTLLYKIGG